MLAFVSKSIYSTLYVENVDRQKNVNVGCIEPIFAQETLIDSNITRTHTWTPNSIQYRGGSFKEIELSRLR